MPHFRLTRYHLGMKIKSLKAQMDKCWKGAHFIDLHVRRNGKWEDHQGDWVRKALEALIEDRKRLKKDIAKLDQAYRVIWRDRRLTRLW